ncbi:MAG: glycosyltransferase [Acidobacteria bacterium]|nr:glycosyltransferase [Acidobacteriota bacterium]
MPAYNAAQTLAATIARIPEGSVDHMILVDDASTDDTIEMAAELGIETIRHPENRGYGGNQKTCYAAALETDCDVIVMLHPDNQYHPGLIPYLVGFIEEGVVDVTFGCRILRRKDVLAGGMPWIKYLANRLLTIIENVAFGYNLPEYHTGYRAFHRRVLEAVPFERCSDDFVFDQQIVAQIRAADFRIGSVPVPTHYADDSSSISFGRSSWYAAGTMGVVARYLAWRAGWRSQELLRGISPDVR